SSPTAPPAARPPRGVARSTPVAIAIPAIGVRSRLLTVGLNPDGTIQVPPLFATPSDAAWFDGSPTPGQVGSAVIEGHIDTYKGPSVFFRLGALRPGDTVDVTLADRTVAVFRVTGVRQYAKDNFPTLTVYGDTSYPSLRLITCGGAFDSATGHYVSNTVVFASLVAHHPAATG
ncbi:MAG: class F sortase, partial [Trebonia sp.]